MYRVLVAVDSDESRARKIAEAVAALPGEPADVEVVLLNVFEEFDAADDGGVVRSEDLYDESAFPDSVAVATDVLEAAGIEVTIRREHGDPASEIVAVADEIDADAIALTGRQRSPAGKVLFGSVTQSVLLSADRPLHVVTVE